MMRTYTYIIFLVALSALFTACQTVLVDFGLREKPAGYVSGADLVFKSLSEIGRAELKRLNMEQRHGTVKFQDDAGLKGKYYKEVMNYDNYYPLEAQPASKATGKDIGYVGYIEYTYRILQSSRTTTGAEAEAAAASIDTGNTGRETYRYKFSSGGAWLGGKGERTSR